MKEGCNRKLALRGSASPKPVPASVDARERFFASFLSVLSGQKTGIVEDLAGKKRCAEGSWHYFCDQKDGSGFGILFDKPEVFYRGLPLINNNYYEATVYFAERLHQEQLPYRPTAMARFSGEPKLLSFETVSLHGAGGDNFRVYAAVNDDFVFSDHILKTKPASAVESGLAGQAQLFVRCGVCEGFNLREGDTVKITDASLVLPNPLVSKEVELAVNLQSKIIECIIKENRKMSNKKEPDFLSEKLAVNINLGEIEMPLKDIFSLRPGTKIEFDLPPVFEAAIDIGGGKIADAEMELAADGITLTVKKLHLASLESHSE